MIIEDALQEFIKADKMLKTNADINFKECQLVDISYFENELEENALFTLPFEEFFCKDEYKKQDKSNEIYCYIKEIKPDYIQVYAFFTTFKNYIIARYYINPFTRKIYNIDAYDDETKPFVVWLQKLSANIVLKACSISPKKTDILKTQAKRILLKNKDGKKEKFKKPIYIMIGKNNTTIKYSVEKTYYKTEHIKSWAVRGHWRKLENSTKRGKDAQDRYIVEGYTWIKSYIKGNKENISKNIYIVENETEQ